MSEGFVTIVSGLPRSGTSLMMQMLAAGGIPPLTDLHRAADESNPRGYFEYEAVRRLRTDHSWLETARGHAVKVIHLLLKELPLDRALEYRVIMMRRPLGEVLSSQRAMLERQGKQAANEVLLAKAFPAQMDEARRWLAAQPVFKVLEIQHPALFENPQPTLATLNEFLGGRLSVSAMAAMIDPALYRQRA